MLFDEIIDSGAVLDVNIIENLNIQQISKHFKSLIGYLKTKLHTLNFFKLV